MAADKSVRSFIILFYVGCIVSYGSCAPVEEKIVLDNGTVLTKVIYDVKEPPPLRYDSELDASHTDEADDPNIIIHEAKYPPAPHVISKRSADDASHTDEADDPNIIIHEAKYPPAPHAMSKRSADDDPEEDDDQNFKIETGQPILTPPPRSDSGIKSDEVSPPGAVAAAAVQTTIGVPKPDEHGDNGASETKRATEPSKSEGLDGKAVSQPDGGGDAKDGDEDKDDNVKEEKTTTPIALPTISTVKVDGSGKNDSKVGSDAERDAKPHVEERGSSTPSVEISVIIKSTTEKKFDEVVDNKSRGEDEPKDRDIATKSSVNTPSDEDGDDDDDQTSDKGDDDGDDDGNDDDGDGEEKDNKSSLDANGNGKPVGVEGEDDEDEYGEDDDPNAADPNADKNAKPNGDEDEDAAEPDDDGLEDDKSLVDGGNNKGKPSISGETSETDGGLKKNTSDEPQSSGHFMSYFLIAVVFVACFYLIFHNRQKIKAYVLEGKTGRGRRRKAGNSEYRQLSTADEVLPDTDKGIESKTTYTY